MKDASEVIKEFNLNTEFGLSEADAWKSRKKYGANVVAIKKKKTPIIRVLEAFCDPMLLILCFALVITLGVNIGKYARSGDGDFIECVGIFVAVLLSVSITVAMEGRSERAFEMLDKISSRSVVKVRRDGLVKLLAHSEIVVGDVVIIESGSRIPCDGKILKAKNLSTDESALTGESANKQKRVGALSKNTPLTDRYDTLFGGTVVSSGSGEMLVTAVGDSAEIGKIAGELHGNKISQPLNEKLKRLGKTVTAIGGISAVVLFVVSLVRLILLGNANFETVQEIFIESVVLIVAAVPEGLPTIVAISLSLNVLKLAKENALIKKLVVAETAGCVSVICSDKTGTLTENRMSVDAFVSAGKRTSELPRAVFENIMLNSEAETVSEGGVLTLSASPTERALIEFAIGKNYKKIDETRNNFLVEEREEFTSDKKYMSTKTRKNGVKTIYYKGSPEKILSLCKRNEVLKEITQYTDKAKRVIAFAREENGRMIFDGFACLSDPVRKDVKTSVALCKKAGIRVKILTGDNAETAFAIAKEAGIATKKSEVINASEIENLLGQKLLDVLNKVTVIARSTPLVKLKVVKALKDAGEVVAVTGDGINDAPAIKQADIGIAMGSGSEIAKEAGDIVLLDDSFSTIVKAISFGRNVYNTFRRFIMFQLSVNLSAVMVVLGSLFLGFKSPFTALQMLWINVIMDGPPALTLGFEPPDNSVMDYPPKRRSDNLLDKKTSARIILHGLFIAVIIMCQMVFNFLGASIEQRGAVVFALFVFFQLFNAFNCRQVGSQSIFKGFFKNKAMLLSFGLASVLQIILTRFGGAPFASSPLGIAMWIKILLTASSILVLSELSKGIYRLKREKNGFFWLVGSRKKLKINA